LFEKEKNIYWLDYLKTLATFAVILLHVSGINVSNQEILGQYAWQVGTVLNTLVRWAVPIFIMISGALILGKEIELFCFLKKRLSRLIPPFLFWSAIYLLYSFYADKAYIELPIMERAEAFYKMFCTNAAFHLWYVYFFIGLTLFTPIINRWILHAPQKEISYFLLVWFVSLFLIQPYIREWVPQIDLSFFASLIGYYVLGYYLFHVDINNWRGSRWVIFILLCVLILFSLYITPSVSLKAGTFTETFNDYTSWNVILITACLFVLFKNFEITNHRMNSFVRLISKHSYGIYLAHLLILARINLWLDPFYIPRPVSSILLGSIVCFMISFLLVILLKQIPVLRKFIG
jgi:surface polysaccharide O-acyltransferase-like enzyme